jgi:hypothetical protein
MKTRNEFAFEFQKRLVPMVAEEVITSDAANMLTGMVSDLLADYALAVADQLVEKYLAWEQMNDGKDESLYSLGLRKAVDILIEIDPTMGNKELVDGYLKELEDEKE